MVTLPYGSVRKVYWNPGASMPLVLPVHVVCNTPDEVIHENIRVNSRNGHPWLKQSDAHDGIAVLCGSGPSLADSLDEICAHCEAGHKIFAMNGAAKFLEKNSVMPDYQVMIDARLATAALVGPARDHLFASQCHPETFAKAPSAILYHMGIPALDDLLPDRGDDYEYSIVGGAASVGNTASCVVFAMGYRHLHYYGFDSCHRDGAGHAFHQSMNDGDPTCQVSFNGKVYTCSLTMKLQAEKFQETARSLEQCGCKIEVHGDGLLPAMWRAPRHVLEEAEKYARIWEEEGYRDTAPGEELVDLFIEKVRPSGLIIDFGCGTGRAALKLNQMGYDVLLIDLVENSRDKEARGLPFMRRDLRDPMPLRAGYGFCTDLMEHIPPSDVNLVLTNIMDTADTVFFQISTVPDKFGLMIDQNLHLTVRPFKWWRDLFTELGFEIEWAEERQIASLFLVKRRTQWQ